MKTGGEKLISDHVSVTPLIGKFQFLWL